MLLHGSVCLLRVEQQHLVYFYTSSYVHKSIGLLRTNRPTALYCTSPKIRIYFRRGFDWDAEKPPTPTKNVDVEQHQGNRLRLQPYILDANLSVTLQLVHVYVPTPQVSAFLDAIWAYVKRRGSLLSMSLMYTFTVVPMVSVRGLPRRGWRVFAFRKNKILARNTYIRCA